MVCMIKTSQYNWFQELRIGGASSSEVGFVLDMIVTNWLGTNKNFPKLTFFEAYYKNRVTNLELVILTFKNRAKIKHSRAIVLFW